MSSARRRKSSDDDDSSGADAGPANATGSDDEDCSPSQYRKARLENDSASGVEDSDRDSENGVESVISSEGPPSLHSSSADGDDEATYRKQFIEDEDKKAARRKEQNAADQKSQKRLKEFCESDTLKRLVAEAIQQAFESRVPDSSGGCSSKDFVDPGRKSDRKFRKQAPPEEFTPPCKRKADLVPETESDDGSIATDSTRTPARKILRAPFILLRSFSREEHSEAEIKAWMETRANAIMDQAGPYAVKKILAEDLGFFKAAQVRNVFHFSSRRIRSNCSDMHSFCRFTIQHPRLVFRIRHTAVRLLIQQAAKCACRFAEGRPQSSCGLPASIL